MKTLQTIQTIDKVARIISKIVFVCCIVGFCLCIVGIVSLAISAPMIKFGGVTLESILQNKANLNEGTLYASMAAGAILCAGEAVLAKFTVHYTERELRDGTPFTFDGAKELLRLGILSICIPLGTQGVAQAVHAILGKVFTDVGPLDLEPAASVGVGILVLILALICKYGAEMCTEKTSADPTENGRTMI